MIFAEIFCDVPSVDCKCSITNGCDGIANSACDSELGSCECLPGYIEDLGRCVIDMGMYGRAEFRIKCEVNLLGLVTIKAVLMLICTCF